MQRRSGDGRGARKKAFDALTRRNANNKKGTRKRNADDASSKDSSAAPTKKKPVGAATKKPAGVATEKGAATKKPAGDAKAKKGKGIKLVAAVMSALPQALRTEVGKLLVFTKADKKRTKGSFTSTISHKSTSLGKSYGVHDFKSVGRMAYAKAVELWEKHM
jgi:hypothetical protein